MSPASGVRQMKTLKLDTDVLIIGDGGAGTTGAIEASKNPKLRISIVTKGLKGTSGATVAASADFSVDSSSLNRLVPSLQGTDIRDSKAKFFEDIVKGGKYLNNQAIVEIQTNEAPQRLKDLLE